MKYIFSTLAMLGVIGAPLMADVTVTRVTKTSGFKGVGGFETRSTDSTSGMKRRSESATAFANKLVNKMAGGGSKVEIILVDQDKAYRIDIRAKTYQESAISQLAQDMKAATGQMQEAKPEQEAPPTHRVTKAEVKVEPTSQSKTINGFSCALTRLTMLMEVEELQTKTKTTNRMVQEIWATPETAALKTLQAEETAFGQAYLKKLGFGMDMQENQRLGLSAMAMGMGVPEKDMEKNMAAMSKELAKLKGVPVLTDVKWFTATDKAAAKPKAEKPKIEEEENEAVDLSEGASGVLGSFANRFAKKKAAQAAEKQAASADPSAPSFSSTMELISVAVTAVPADSFAVPAGFKKVK
jgi:hypothetical protein